MAALSLATGPVSADEVGTDTDVTTACVSGDSAVDEIDVDEVKTETADDDAADDDAADDDAADDDAADLEEIAAAAADAVAAATGIEEDDGCDTGLDRAKESLQAAFERLSKDGVGGNGVAAQVLELLINRESHGGIGAEVKKIAADRQAEREAAGHGQPEDKGRPNDGGQSDDDGDTDDSGQSDDKGRPDDSGQPEDIDRPDEVVQPESNDDDNDDGSADASAVDSGETPNRPEKSGNGRGKGRP